MQKITIHVEPAYEMLVENGALARLGEFTARAVSGRKAALMTDDVVDRLYGDKAVLSLQKAGFEVVRFVFAHGEGSKNLETWSRMLCFLAQENLSRSDVVIALGGGVTGDMAGFAASAYLRGIAVVQVPTTLLAAIDSSVGGKTAVDLPQGKNLAGAFHQPVLVVCDPETFSTLPPEFLADGMAEAIKAAVIGDPELLSLLSEKTVEPHQWEEIILRSVEVKRRLVEDDVLDQGNRQLLNLGHTMAHGIEKLSCFAVSHGHAVAMGTAAMARAAFGLGICTLQCVQEIDKALSARGLKTPCPYPAEELALAAVHDKKRKGDKVTLVLPKDMGECILHLVAMEELPYIFAIGLEENRWK